MDEKQKEYENIINELIYTEKAYMKDMSETYESYNDVFSSRFEFPDTIKCLEAIPSIVICGEKLQSGISKNRDDPKKIAGVFDELLDELKMQYSEYCSTFPAASMELEPANIDEELDLLLSKAKEKFNQLLPLQSYLLKPVQRILKYPLLIKSILKLKLMDEENHEILENTCKKVNIMADYINEKKREKEGIALIYRFNKAITNLKEKLTLSSVGPVQQHDEFFKGSRKFYVILFTKILLVTKPIGGQKYNMHKAFPISDMILLENAPKCETAFIISLYSNRKKTITLDAKNIETKNKWITHLKALILENMSVNLNNTKLEAMLGQSVGTRVQTILSVKEDVAASNDRSSQAYSTFSSRVPESNQTEVFSAISSSSCAQYMSLRKKPKTSSPNVSTSSKLYKTMKPTQKSSKTNIGAVKVAQEEKNQPEVLAVETKKQRNSYIAHKTQGTLDVLNTIANKDSKSSKRTVPWSKAFIFEAMAETDGILRLSEEGAEKELAKCTQEQSRIRAEISNLTHSKMVTNKKKQLQEKAAMTCQDTARQSLLEESPRAKIISERVACKVQKLLESQKVEKNTTEDSMAKVSQSHAHLVRHRLMQLQEKLIQDIHYDGDEEEDEKN